MCFGQRIRVHLFEDVYKRQADIAYRVAEVLKLDRSLILPVTTEEMQEATPRPRFSGLSIVKAKREINYNPHTLEEGIKEMFT